MIGFYLLLNVSNEQTPNRKLINQAEKLIKKDDLLGAVEFLLKNLGPNYFMVRLRLIGLARQLHHLKKVFLSGQVSHENYSVGRTKLANLLLFIVRGLERSNIRLIKLLAWSLSLIFGVFLLTYSISRDRDGIGVSLPKVRKTKITFQIFNKSDIDNRISFVLKIPADNQNRLMLPSDVKLILPPKDTIQTDIIEKTEFPDGMIGEEILEQFRDIKRNEVEVQSLKKGFFKLEFFTKENYKGHSNEIFHYFEIYCHREDNIDLPCKKRMVIWDYLQQFQVKFSIILWTIISFIFLVILAYRSLNFSSL